MSTSQAYLRVRKLENILISQIDQERVDTWRQKKEKSSQKVEAKVGEKQKKKKKSEVNIKIY